MSTRNILSRLIVILASGVFLLNFGDQAIANDKLLEILKSKGILTDEQFEELQKESKKELKAVFKDGFFLESADKNFSIKFGGRVQGDFRYFNDNNANDTFDVRRAYLEAGGTLYRYWDYKIEVDFAGSSGTTSSIKDAFINYKYFPEAQIRVGQFYYPYGNELTVSDKYYVFLEASSISSALAPGRDRGIEVHGNPMKGLLHYEVGIFNGAGENTAENNDDFDYAARVVFNPTSGKEGPFQAWVGASYGYGQQVGKNSNDIRVRTESNSGNAYFTAAIPTTRGFDRERMGLEAAVQYGPVMLKGEFLRTEYDFEKKADVEGGYVTASWFLTGEQKAVRNGQTVRQTAIKKPFDPAKGQLGAWEVAARYSWFEVDDKFFETGGIYPGWTAISKTTNVNEGDAWSVAINWYPSSLVRLMANWVHSEASNDLTGGTSNIFTHDGGNKTDVEDALLVRVQIEW